MAQILFWRFNGGRATSFCPGWTQKEEGQEEHRMGKKRRKVEVKSQSVEVRGGKVHFLVAGPPKAQAVVLLHGATLTSET